MSITLNNIVSDYKRKFREDRKPTVDVGDLLMEKLRLKPEQKRLDMQFYSSNLGRCWEKLLCSVFEESGKGKKSEKLEYDIACQEDAIDTKYRVGSQDGTKIGKLAANGKMLKEAGLNPIMLILRTDNYKEGLRTIKAAGWTVHEGQAVFDYILQKTGCDFRQWLVGEPDLDQMVA